MRMKLLRNEICNFRDNVEFWIWRANFASSFYLISLIFIQKTIFSKLFEFFLFLNNRKWVFYKNSNILKIPRYFLINNNINFNRIYFSVFDHHNKIQIFHFCNEKFAFVYIEKKFNFLIFFKNFIDVFDIIFFDYRCKSICHSNKRYKSYFNIREM